jgi:hypothetical protein
MGVVSVCVEYNINIIMSSYFSYKQRFRGMGVANKKERRRNEGKAGMAAVLEGINGSHEL